MDKKLTIKESFNLGKGWNLMIFAILAMLVTNAGVNDGLNIALPEIAKGAGLDYELFIHFPSPVFRNLNRLIRCIFFTLFLSLL